MTTQTTSANSPNLELVLAPETKTALENFATWASATLALMALQTLPTNAIAEPLPTPPSKHKSYHLLAPLEFARSPTPALQTLNVNPTSA